MVLQNSLLARKKVCGYYCCSWESDVMLSCMIIQEFKYIIQMSDKPAPRSQTSDKYKKYDDPNKFIPQNVVIDSDTKSPRYLTSFSASGMRRLTETQKKIYDAYLKSKDQKGIKHPQYFQIAKETKIENVHPSKKERQSRYINQEDNYYQTSELIKNKIGGGAVAEKHKNHFKQYDEKKLEQKFRKKEIEGVGLKKVQKKQEEKNEQLMKDSMTNSALKLADRAIQDIKKSQAILQGDLPRQPYFDNQFNLMFQQMKYMRQAIRLLEKTSGQKKLEEKEVRQSFSNDKIKVQLQQALKARDYLQIQRNKIKANYEDLLIKFQQSQGIRKELQVKNENLANSLVDTTQKMKELRRKYDDVCKMYEQLQRQSSSARHNQAKIQKQALRKVQQIKFHSALAIENNITTFLNGPIEAITKKHLKTSRLIYQKDDFNTNITNYLDRPPFPLVILFNTGKSVFGVFAEGIQSYRTNKMKEDDIFERPFKVFLFNATNKVIFERDQRSKVTCGLSYFENHLKFGNNQLVLKNNALINMKILGSSIFGQKYFILPKRHLLTGEDTQIIQIKEMEIFEVFLSDF